MKKITKTLLLGWTFFLCGCPVYDPPIKGQEIYIENQTYDYVYVIDSLTGSGKPRLYDTFLVNNKKFISKMGNYILGYSAWTYFLSEPEYLNLKKMKINKINFCFIKPSNVNKTFKEIDSNKLYKALSVDIEEVRKNSINHIVYYNDSIILEHQNDLEVIKKK